MKLSYYPYDLYLKHTFVVSGSSRTFTPDVQVEIEQDGVVGYGEASLPPYLGETRESVLAFLRKVSLKDVPVPFSLEEVLGFIDSIEAGNCAAKAALDIALHDLFGKLMDRPCYKLWGLNREDTPYTSYTIGIDTPEVIRTKVKEVEGKFRILKVKLGSDRDQEIVRAIRQVSDLPFMVDANQGWTDRVKVLEMIHWLKEEGCILIEQPLSKERLEDSAWITQQSPLPVIADESVQRLEDIARIKGAFHGINIKLMKCTGMGEASKMIETARKEGMQVMLGCMTETSCAISAAAQLAPAVDYADLDGNLLIRNNLFRGVKIQEGRIMLNERPGIGVLKLS
ncbi:MAG: dipeptide epimerase [Bacteroides sp.]|nr:dipeptide epimerase [Bacteroides sp.]